LSLSPETLKLLRAEIISDEYKENQVSEKSPEEKLFDEALQYFEWMPKDKSSFLSKMAPADVIKFYQTMGKFDNVVEKQVDKNETIETKLNFKFSFDGTNSAKKDE
jgi:hypothetical protein